MNKSLLAHIKQWGGKSWILKVQDSSSIFFFFSCLLSWALQDKWQAEQLCTMSQSISQQHELTVDAAGTHTHEVTGRPCLLLLPAASAEVNPYSVPPGPVTWGHQTSKLKTTSDLLPASASKSPCSTTSSLPWRSHLQLPGAAGKARKQHGPAAALALPRTKANKRLLSHLYAEIALEWFH